MYTYRIIVIFGIVGLMTGCAIDGGTNVKLNLKKTEDLIETENGSSMSPEELDEYAKEYFANYDRIQEVRFSELYGNVASSEPIGAAVKITKREIIYSVPTDILLGYGNIDTYTKKFDEYNWGKLLDIMKKYQLEGWKIQGDYIYENYNDGPSHHIKNKNIEYVREGDFFNIDGDMTDYSMDERMFRFRSSYHGSVFIISDEDYYFWSDLTIGEFGQLGNYGVPYNYNEFRKEFWNYVIEYTGGKDWREDLDEVGKEVMYKLYPDLK